MKGNALFLILMIFYVASQAIPHGAEHEKTHDDVDVSSPNELSAPPVPTNETSADANATTAHSSPDDEGRKVHSGSHTDMDMDDMDGMGGMGHSGHPHPPIVDGSISPEEMSYWLWPEHRGLLYAHVIIMVISWGFLLPVGTFPFALNTN